MNKAKVIGLTGGIASGKSTVLKEFKKLGAKVIDSDKIAHRIIQKDKKVYREIIKYFGRRILKKDGKIDRKKLGKIVFEDKNKLKLLEKITHPAIISEIKKTLTRLLTYPLTRLIVLDAPLLFEKSLSKMVDETVVVWVPEEIQIQRLISRDKLGYESAKKRIKLQMPLDKKKKLADYCIDGSKSLKKIKQQIKKFWKKLLKKTIDKQK